MAQVQGLMHLKVRGVPVAITVNTTLQEVHDKLCSITGLDTREHFSLRMSKIYDLEQNSIELAVLADSTSRVSECVKFIPGSYVAIFRLGGGNN